LRSPSKKQRLHLARSLAQHVERAIDLAPPLGGTQAEMRDHREERPAVDKQVGRDRAARLVALDREIDVPHRAHRETREQHIAEAAAVTADVDAGMEACRCGKVIPLIHVAIEAMPRIDLLQLPSFGMTRDGTRRSAVAAPARRNCRMWRACIAHVRLQPEKLMGEGETS
jgi:hypothetical protein